MVIVIYSPQKIPGFGICGRSRLRVLRSHHENLFSPPSMKIYFQIRPGELRFIRNSPNFGKMSIAVRRANEKPESDGLWFLLCCGDRTRTCDLRVMSPTSCHCSTPRRFIEANYFTTYSWQSQGIFRPTLFLVFFVHSTWSARGYEPNTRNINAYSPRWLRAR